MGEMENVVVLSNALSVRRWKTIWRTMMIAISAGNERRLV